MTSVLVIAHIPLCNDNLPSVCGAHMKPIWKQVLFPHSKGMTSDHQKVIVKRIPNGFCMGSSE